MKNVTKILLKKKLNYFMVFEISINFVLFFCVILLITTTFLHPESKFNAGHIWYMYVYEMT